MSKRRTVMNNKEIIDGKAIVLDEGTPEPPVDDDQKDQGSTTTPNNKSNPVPEAGDEDDEEDEEFFGKRIWRKTPKWLKVGLGLTAAAGLGFLLGGVVMNHGSDDTDDDREDDVLYIESDDTPEIGFHEEPSNSYTETPTPETVVEE